MGIHAQQHTRLLVVTTRFSFHNVVPLLGQKGKSNWWHFAIHTCTQKLWDCNEMYPSIQLGIWCIRIGRSFKCEIKEMWHKRHLTILLGSVIKDWDHFRNAIRLGDNKKTSCDRVDSVTKWVKSHQFSWCYYWPSSFTLLGWMWPCTTNYKVIRKICFWPKITGTCWTNPLRPKLH